MARTRRTVTVGITALTALAGLALTAPAASAATTTIRAGSATAAPYSGNVRASLVGVATVSTYLGSGSCNESTLNGSIQSNGTGLSVSSASFTNDGGPCTGAVTSTITSQALPWSGGSVVFDSAHTNNRDATITIANYRVRAVVDLLGGITCIYGGNLVLDAYNLDNPNRPDTSVNEAQVRANGATITKVAAGSNIFCPDTATATATYKLLGESSAGSGTFDQSLYATE